MEFLDEFIKGLLHTDDVRGNRLLDVGVMGEGGSDKAYRLFCDSGNNSATMLNVIRARRGKPSNKTVLSDSALLKATVSGSLTEKWDWADLSGVKKAAALDKFITAAYNALDLKGNNPLFLGVGLLSWSVAHGDGVRNVNSPLLIFPIRLVRGTNTSNVEIEFVDDDAYFNPCLIARMRDELSESVCANFPHPNGVGQSFDDAIDLDKLGDGAEYMERVSEFVTALGGSMSFDKDILTIAQYNHSDICMYYDVRRNKQKIYAHPLVQRVFGGGAPLPREDDGEVATRPVLPTDSVQDKIISKVAAGRSIIIKGPPGTGKTLTIANMLSTLLAQGKSVLVASEKLSALAEVYAKLPERLRKFVMLLDYETEQKAAAVNPAEVRAEFKRLIKNKKEYVYDGKYDLKYSRADRAKAEAMIALGDYQAEVFGDDVAWGSYYDALDTYYKDADLPVIEFTDGSTAASISREDYNKLLLGVKECAAHYERLMQGGKVSLSPWYGVSDKADIEGAIVALKSVAAVMTEINGVTERLEKQYPDISWSDCTYGDLHDAALPNAIAGEDIVKAVTGLKKSDGELLTMLADNYEKAKLSATDADKFIFTGSAVSDCFTRLSDIKTVRGLQLSVVNTVANNSELFLVGGMTDQAAAKFTQTVNNVYELKTERDTLAAEVLFVFDKAKLNDTQLLKACAALAPYASGDKPSVGMFDFKAKSAEKKLRAVCSRTDITLKELAATAVSYSRIAECDGKIDGLSGVLTHVVGLNALTAEQTECILSVAKYSAALGVDMREFVSECKTAAGIIADTKGFVKTPDDYVIDSFVSAVELVRAQSELNVALSAMCGRCGIAEAPNMLLQVHSLSALLRIYHSPQFNCDAQKTEKFVSVLQGESTLVANVATAVSKLKDFGGKYFVNAYAAAPWHVTPRNSKILIAQATDRSMAAAALGYDNIIHGKNALPLDMFFTPIEDGRVEVGPQRFVDLFVHSYLALVIDRKISTMGNARNGLGKAVELAIKNFIDAENEIYDCNAVRAESLCMARIDAEDDDFDFLAVDKGINMSLRVMFRNYAKAILKLKKCFILSPSTASVLFRGEAYENFDVVIVDEASQMEPVDLLPVLFRSKQCVLVGDEYQMPPLTHFKAKNRKRISDEATELTLDTDISALSLALGNLAFDAEELVCHYRSKTESLIEFSQREFYPYMRTFPATVPATPDLGFTDILVEDGYCEDGVNVPEANAVIAALKEHFDKYYDKNKGTLSTSVGVVTFGEAQLKYVLSLVHADKKLNAMIENAWHNFDDVPDKLVFFRTIESVQGQETDNLILSLTYGKDKNGKIKLAFGELNRDDTGKNIFNVAVTRAKNKVTVIHTLTSRQMAGNARIAFIRSYLAGVERFADKSAQFVSAVPEKGEHFISAVASYIESLGIAKERIVTDYGVTDGSVRIPIAVLSKDLTRAELGLWCELPVQKKYDYFDYNARYVTSLIGRGWTLHKVHIHDYFDNTKAEQAAINAAVQKFVTK
ncbi:MAG: DUF4011 domain-containing protein [Clostridiales bacterium]|nr:DUF4011 domain-containing protein [Clostridiales bacterium]